MKIPSLLCTAVLFAVVKSALADDLDSLPAAVQKTAKAEVKDAKIEEVEDTFEDGQRAYEVEFLRDHEKLAIVISERGKLIQLEHRLSISDAPAAIKESALKKFPGGKISHLKKIEKNGATYFEVTVDADGKAHAFQLNENGSKFAPRPDVDAR